MTRGCAALADHSCANEGERERESARVCRWYIGAVTLRIVVLVLVVLVRLRTATLACVRFEFRVRRSWVDVGVECVGAVGLIGCFCLRAHGRTRGRTEQLPQRSPPGADKVALKTEYLILLEPDVTIHGPITRHPTHDAGGLHVKDRRARDPSGSFLAVRRDCILPHRYCLLLCVWPSASFGLHACLCSQCPSAMRSDVPYLGLRLRWWSRRHLSCPSSSARDFRARAVTAGKNASPAWGHLHRRAHARKSANREKYEHSRHSRRRWPLGRLWPFTAGDFITQHGARCYREDPEGLGTQLACTSREAYEAHRPSGRHAFEWFGHE